jgi:hypothetical protein
MPRHGHAPPHRSARGGHARSWGSPASANNESEVPPNLRQGDFDESQEAKLRAATAALPPPGGEPMRQAPGGFDQPSKHLNKRKLERR